MARREQLLIDGHVFVVVKDVEALNKHATTASSFPVYNPAECYKNI